MVVSFINALVENLVVVIHEPADIICFVIHLFIK